jgi:hypothetical protein
MDRKELAGRSIHYMPEGTLPPLYKDEAPQATLFDSIIVRAGRSSAGAST